MIAKNKLELCAIRIVEPNDQYHNDTSGINFATSGTLMQMTIILGFVFGMLSALFFALYMLPQKLGKIDHTTYIWTMGVGVLITALIPYVWMGCPHASTWPQRGYALLCGVVWGVGTLAFATAIHRIGLALATPFKNTTGVIGTLVGLLLFHEYKTTNPWLALGGSILIVVAAILIGQTGHADTPRRSVLAGIGFSLIAALCYASYLYPMKIVVKAIGYWEFTPWMAAGILLTATVAVLARPGGVRAFRAYSPRLLASSLLGGMAWTIALFCLAASMDMVDLSVAWSLAQLNTVPAVFFGIVLFHEVHVPSHWRTLAIGLLAATVGTILLGFSK